VPHIKLQSVFKHITSVLSESAKVLITLKEGQGTLTDKHGRTFYLWQESELRPIFNKLGFIVLDFTTQISKIQTNDIWLGFVLEKTSISHNNI